MRAAEPAQRLTAARRVSTTTCCMATTVTPLALQPPSVSHVGFWFHLPDSRPLPQEPTGHFPTGSSHPPGTDSSLPDNPPRDHRQLTSRQSERAQPRTGHGSHGPPSLPPSLVRTGRASLRRAAGMFAAVTPPPVTSPCSSEYAKCTQGRGHRVTRSP